MDPSISRVASLNVDNVDLSASVSWLHKFSPTLKSLYVYPTLSLGSPFFGLIHSSPLLEDLTIVGYDPFGNDDGVLHGPRIVGPSTSPPLAGSLDLEISAGVGYAARRLLDLPTGLHFRNLTLTRFHTGDVRWIAELVERCSDTLEYLDITCRLPSTYVFILRHDYTYVLFPVESEPVPIDLSKATKLKGAVFRLDSEGIEWVTLALRTVTPEHRALRQISIYVPHWFPFLSLGVNIRPVLREENSKRWSDLDHLLFQFWESHSIRPRVGCKGLGEKGQNLVHFIGFLFPKTMQRGIIDLDY